MFCENSRAYTVLHTDHFGQVVQVEVGALLVGRICNLHGAGPIQRGAEKGRFEFGGSTVIVLLQKAAVGPDPALLARTAADLSGDAQITRKHLLEVLQLRCGLHRLLLQ